MDSASTADWIKDRKTKELNLPEQDVPDLKKFSVELQHRIAQAEESATLHFRFEDIQLLVAELAMSHPFKSCKPGKPRSQKSSIGWCINRQGLTNKQPKPVKWKYFDSTRRILPI